MANERVCEDTSRICPDRWMSESTMAQYCPNKRCMRNNSVRGVNLLLRNFVESLSHEDRVELMDYLNSRYIN